MPSPRRGAAPPLGPPITICRVIAVVLLMMAMAGTAQAQADTSVRCTQWKAAMAREDSVAVNQGAARGSALLARPTSAASHGCLWAAVDGYVVGLQNDPRATSFWVSYAADILVNSLGRPDSAVSLYRARGGT